MPEEWERQAKAIGRETGNTSLGYAVATRDFEKKHHGETPQHAVKEGGMTDELGQAVGGFFKEWPMPRRSTQTRSSPLRTPAFLPRRLS